MLDAEGLEIPVAISASVVREQGEAMARGLVFIAKDISERLRHESHLNHMATHDALTNLPNRALLLDRLSQALSRLPWRDRLVAVFFLDLDRFKLINDTLGHDVGDELLLNVGGRLSELVRA